MSNSKKLLIAGTSLCLLYSAPNFAQNDGGDTFSLEEIVVIARKREESLQEVPVSISVLGENLIADANILSQNDLFELVPGIYYDEGPDRNAAFPSVRGVQANEIATNRTKVTAFIDGMPILGSQGALGFGNVAQVEVYRGPQSAAFGRSTFGGAINYVTRDPGEELDGSLSLDASDYLTKEAYTTHWLTRGNEVVSWIQQNDSQLILLDVMLPGKDGIDICREIRTFSDIPIIMITARIEEIDRLLGLELGADDYICKPFSPREVVARVKTILRRIANQQALGTGYLGLEINEEQHRATIDGHILNLTPIEFRLLSVLFSQPGRVYSRNQLLNQIFDDSYIISDRTIDSHIKNLRKKVRELHPREDIVQTVYGVGYKLE